MFDFSDIGMNPNDQVIRPDQRHIMDGRFSLSYLARINMAREQIEETKALMINDLNQGRITQESPLYANTLDNDRLLEGINIQKKHVRANVSTNIMEKDKATIKSLHVKNMSMKKIAEHFELPVDEVSDIINNKS